jgi:hypothetical protein
MKIHVLVSSVVFIGALALTYPARSSTISIKGHNPDQVQGKCEGGTYFGPSDKGVYGCLAGDGSGIVCGGKGDNYANTCDTWGAAPDAAHKRTKLPTREEMKALSAKATNK